MVKKKVLKKRQTECKQGILKSIYFIYMIFYVCIKVIYDSKMSV